jgi:site-specific DNA-methyltransferase (adenine-specific)
MNSLALYPAAVTSINHKDNNHYEPNLVCGDWFKVCDLVVKESIDLILTDLPYGILDSQEWDKEIDLKQLEQTIDYALKPNGQFITFCNQGLFQRLLAEFTVFKQRSLHIWHKSSPMPINEYMPLPDFEFIVVFKKIKAKTVDLAWNPTNMLPGGLPYINKSKVLKSPTRRHNKSEILINASGARWIHSVMEAPNKPNMAYSERTSHPTQKPEQLLRQLIRGYSDSGQLVLDPFAGSFSTVISAYKEKRRSIGVEIEPKYYEESQKRINNIITQQELF